MRKTRGGFRGVEGSPEGKRVFGILDVRTWEYNIKAVLKSVWRAWIVVIRLRTGKSGGLLCTR